MRYVLFPAVLVSFTLLFLFPAAVHPAVDPDLSSGSPALSAADLNPLQPFFIPNRGQMDRGVAFYARTAGGAVFVTDDGIIVYALPGEPDSSLSKAAESPRAVVFRERFVGFGKARVEGVDRTKTLVNSYRGADPEKWRQGLPTFRTLDIGTLKDSIEIRLKGTRQGVEKLFYIEPDGDVSDIRVHVSGIERLTCDIRGQLVVETSHGAFSFTPPIAYQEIDGSRRPVEVAYLVDGKEYGFSVGKYDRTLPLVIDPLLASTYLGGSGDESAVTVAETGGATIIGGTVNSPDFPGLSSSVDSLGDALIVKLDTNLTTVFNATYFGGSMADGVRDMAVGPDTIYVTGTNNSQNFPTTPGAAYLGSILTGAFVARLSTDSLAVEAATSFYSNVYAIARQPGGSVYIAGSTTNTLFPASDEAYLGTHQGSSDGYIARLSSDLTTLEAATFLGGERMEIIYDLALTSSGEPVVGGLTNSISFPTTPGVVGTSYSLDPGATFEWFDGFVSRLSGDLGTLAVSTYVGGGLDDQISALALDGDNVVVGGFTVSKDFPCATTIGPVSGYDAFVVRLDNSFSGAYDCAVFGGGAVSVGTWDAVTSLAIGGAGEVYVTGTTDSDDYPNLSGAWFTTTPVSYSGGFISALSSDLSTFDASTLIHGAGEDLDAIVVGAAGELIVTGQADNPGYPVTGGALQSAPAGGDDIIVSRFTADLAADATDPEISLDVTSIDFGDVDAGQARSDTVTVYNSGGSTLTISEVSMASGSSSDFSQANTCGTVPPAGSCTVTVTFTPSGTGVKTGALQISSNDLDSPVVEVTLTGTGMAVQAITVSPSSLVFGEMEVGRATSVQYLTVTNNGISDLVFYSIGVDGDNPSDFKIAVDGCTGSPLSPAGQCSITVLFAPQSHGPLTAQLEISSNDPSTPVYSVPLSGSGVIYQDIVTLPNPCNFGSISIGSSASRTVEVENRGYRDLHITSVTMAGASPDQFQLTDNTCTNATLPARSGTAAASMCELDVQFTPTTTDDTRAEIHIQSDDPIEPLHTVLLIGNGPDLQGGGGGGCNTFPAAGDPVWPEVILLALIFGVVACRRYRSKTPE